MKSFIVLLLISYIFTQAPTSVTLELATQSLTSSDTEVKLTVTAAGNPMSLSGLTNLILKSTENPLTTIALTCSFSPAVSCAADSATEVTCTATLTAGTYQLATSDSTTMTATGADNNPISSVTPTVANADTTITVTQPVAPTSVTLDLKSQELATTATQVKLLVTAAGGSMSLSALTNLVLQSTETPSTTIALTCSFSPAVSCAADSATEVTCTVASLTAGTYKLAGVDGQTISMTATYGEGTAITGVTPAVAASPTSITVSTNVVNPPTSVTLDLKASQTLTVGKEGSVIIKVTADQAMTLSALTNLVLQSTETKTTTIALTCSFSPALSCAANTAKEATCKVAAPTTAGTYKLAAAADKSITMTATYGEGTAVSGVTPAVAATPTSLTVSTASSNENTNPSGEGESDDDNSSFLKFSYIMFFIAFLF